MATTSLTLDDDLEARIDKLADKRGQSSDALMRAVLTEYVDRAEAGEQAWEEADASWENFRANGRHLTGDELFAWLKQWGTGATPPLPDCHD